MSKKELKGRWGSPINGKQLKESPFGLHNEKLDFRGIQFSWPLKDFSVSKADFTGACLKNDQFTHAFFNGCDLVDVRLEGTIYGDRFLECDFNKASLNATLCDVAFEKCNFSQVNFKKSTTNNRVVFSDSKFTDCDLSKVHFMDATFKNCIFKNCKAGKWTSFAYSKFVGCDVSEMDFGDSIMDDVVFE